MLHLYELSQAYNSLINALDNEEINQDELLKVIQEVEGQFKDKAINIGKLIRSFDAENEAIQSEVKRLQGRQFSLNKNAERLKSYLLTEMITANIDKIDGDVMSIQTRKNPPSVNVVNESEIPPEYIRIIPERKEVDKAKILKTFKDNGGEIVNGVEIITNKKSLVIK